MWLRQLSLVEKLVLILDLVIVFAGLFLYYTDVIAFEDFVREDHLVEWLTVLGLISASLVSFYRFFKLFKKRNAWFLTVNFILGLLLFIAAGEEISWGQRILGIESSGYFEENNLQGETNLHNLEIDGVKINKLVFTTLLGLTLAMYLVIFPILYAKNQPFRKFIHYSGISIARLYQIIGFLIVIILTALIRHDKNPELLECGASLLFFLVIACPVNRQIFSRKTI
ncbi:MAG: hypothetical protein ACXWCR_14300 [Flavitalea sp.]